MPYLHVHLEVPRFTYVEQAGRLVHRIWFEGQFTESELVTEDHEGSHHIRHCVVIFTESADAYASGQLKYQAAWRDPEDTKLHPGSCELTFAASTAFMSFLDSFASRDMELHMLVLLEAQMPAVHRLGDDVAWYPSQQNPLPSKLESIGFVPRTKCTQ